MQIDASTLALFLALGTAAGFLGGLLGIGGGLVLVPGLYYAFTKAGLAPGHEMTLALGTTMAGILFTAAGSVRAHVARGAVRFDLVKRFAPWIAGGTLVGAALASQLDPSLVKTGFAAFCMYTAARMLFFSKPRAGGGPDIAEAKLPVPGLVFGTVCGFIGVGGATVIVPYLFKRNVEIRHAMATASALQIPVALVGSVSYMMLGAAESTPPGAVGFIYLPALAVVALASMAAAPLGVNVANRVPVPALKKLFGVFVALVGLKMAGVFSLAAAMVAGT